MLTRHVNTVKKWSQATRKTGKNRENEESGAALILSVITLSVIAGLIAAASIELTQQNAETTAQMANYNESRTAALVGIAGVKDFLNAVQTRPNTAHGAQTSCGTNPICQVTSAITNAFWGNSSGNTVIPPNGGLGAIGYFKPGALDIKNISLKNSTPYINATVDVRIVGNTYQIAAEKTSDNSAVPPAPGLITVISQGMSGQSSAIAEAVLGPVAYAPGVENTSLFVHGKTTADKIVNEAPAAQHTYLQTSKTITTPSGGTAPTGFTSIIQHSTQSQVNISARTLKNQANLIFEPPTNGQTYPRVSLKNIAGNENLDNGPYRLSPTAVSQGVCTWSVLGYCLGQRVPIFAPGTSLSYDSQTSTWSLGNPSSSPALLIPGAAYFSGNVTLSTGVVDNAIISTGNIVDDGTVYAPNYAGPTDVCGWPAQTANQISPGLYPTNFCGPQGTQYIPASIGNIALYADGTTTIGNNASVYGDILSRGNLSTDNLTEYGFIVAEGKSNNLSGTTTIDNNNAAPSTFNPTVLNASKYSATSPSISSMTQESIGLLGLQWIS